MTSVIPVHGDSVGSGSRCGVRWVGCGVIIHAYGKVDIKCAVAGGVGESSEQELKVVVYLVKG